jgi:hypothetical protein
VAQEATIRVSASPYYAGIPIDIQVIADGFSQSPEPAIEVDAPSGSDLRLLGVSPNISSSIRIINGRMTRSETVRYVYRYRLQPKQPGTLEVGPFRVFQNGTAASTSVARFEIQETPTTAEQRIRLVIPDGPLWVGQRVPVKLEWWLGESFADRLAGRRLQVPLFDRLDLFAFEDVKPDGARTTLTVDTAAGEIELLASVRSEDWEGKPYLVVSAERVMIPLRPGEVEIEPASVVTEEAVRWSTDLFGNRTPTQVRRYRVQDEPQTVMFATPPVAGRPPSFSGAIGTGFSIAASADRSVVQAGDPVKLSLTVRGDASFESVSLPKLTASGLDSQDFGVSEEPLAGLIEEDGKRFTVALRVKHDRVREIPPIAFSWFNPDHGRYETTYSRPIALSVRAATVVSAGDVVTAESTGAGADDQSATQARPFSTAETPATRPTFTLSGAELAIETRSEALTRGAHPWFAHPAVQAGAYLAGLAAVGLALFIGKRRQVEPEIRERLRVLETERLSLEQAGDPGTIASTLRRMAAAAPQVPRAELDALLLECDNLSYSRSTANRSAVDPALRARARAVAESVLAAAR